MSQKYSKNKKKTQSNKPWYPPTKEVFAIACKTKEGKRAMITMCIAVAGAFVVAAFLTASNYLVFFEVILGVMVLSATSNFSKTVSAINADFFTYRKQYLENDGQSGQE